MVVTQHRHSSWLNIEVGAVRQRHLQPACDEAAIEMAVRHDEYVTGVMPFVEILLVVFLHLYKIIIK